MILDSNNWYVSGYLEFWTVSAQNKKATNGIGIPCLGRYEARQDSTVNSKPTRSSNILPKIGAQITRILLMF
jgi:hypothetical protein